MKIEGKKNNKGKKKARLRSFELKILFILFFFFFFVFFWKNKLI